ncbi:MAG: M3 family oligoendopeptidase [Oscillospiraceae bacterium]|nr:M3 family oligoendopeptidase [Oscillospiraceae bacterium]
MRFSEFPYARPDTEAFKEKLLSCARRIKEAQNVQEQISAFDEATALSEEYYTMGSLAYVRNTINTADEFYDKEREFYDEIGPELQAVSQEVDVALLDSSFRTELEAHYGKLIFDNMEIQRRSFKPELIPLMQEAGKLEAQYQKLYAGLTVEFDGKTMPLPMLGAYKESPDRAVRRAAYEAEGKVFDANREELDEIFDKLVKNRNAQGRLMGYENYLQLGYDRLGRNCYGGKELAAFREQIARDLVPIIAEVKEAQRKRIGVDKLCIYDDKFRFPDGNAKPEGTPDEILAAGKAMYQELSPETKEFIEDMFDGDLFDVLSREGKAPGGYCTTFSTYKMPFIFSNFNGTAGDVDVLTHEAGHAFAFYRSMRSGIHPALQQATIEACECHSMSMEFLTQDYHKNFFGSNTAKYQLAHCEDSLDFIPYGCMIDEFQHRMYENENLTPEERNAVWQELERKYRPWLDMDNLPFYGRYSHWQWKLHVYLHPLYYIDYCMAGTVAFQLWTLSMKDRQAAWKKYLAFVDAAGTKTFAELCLGAGLQIPYEEGAIKSIGEGIRDWMANNPLAQ